MLQWIEKYLELKGIYTSDKFRRAEQFSDCFLDFIFGKIFQGHKPLRGNDVQVSTFEILFIYHSFNLGGRSNHGQF